MVSMAGVRDAISAAVDKMVDDWAQMRLVGSASAHLLLVPPPPTRAKDKKEVPAHPQEAVLGYVCNDKKCEKPCFYHQLQRGQGRRVNGGLWAPWPKSESSKCKQVHRCQHPET